MGNSGMDHAKPRLIAISWMV